MNYGKRSAPPGPPPPPDAEPEATANPEAHTHTKTDARTEHCAHGLVKSAPGSAESAAHLEAAVTTMRADLLAHAVKQVEDHELAQMVVDEVLRYVRGSVLNGRIFASQAAACQELRDTTGVACAAALSERDLADHEAVRYAESLPAHDKRRETLGEVWLRLRRTAARTMLSRATSSDERVRWVGGVARMVARENHRSDGRPRRFVDDAPEVATEGAPEDGEDIALHEIDVRRALQLVRQDFPALVEFAGLEEPVCVRERVRACRLRPLARRRLREEGLHLEEILGAQPPARRRSER